MSEEKGEGSRPPRKKEGKAGPDEERAIDLSKTRPKPPKEDGPDRPNPGQDETRRRPDDP